MTSKVNPIPAGYTTVTPYLVMQNAAEALEFYKKAFNAVENFRMPMPNGNIGHAELKIGNSMVMMADECPEMSFYGPKKFGGSPVSLHLYVDNVDEWFKRAITAGGKEIKPVADQFYGDRMGMLQDPFGHMWTLSTHVEDLTMEEITKRKDAMFSV
ncbi:MAG: VOC family protein [Pseudomonadota bacterium]